MRRKLVILIFKIEVGANYGDGCGDL